MPLCGKPLQSFLPSHPRLPTIWPSCWKRGMCEGHWLHPVSSAASPSACHLFIHAHQPGIEIPLPGRPAWRQVLPQSQPAVRSVEHLGLLQQMELGSISAPGGSPKKGMCWRLKLGEPRGRRQSSIIWRWESGSEVQRTEGVPPNWEQVKTTKISSSYSQLLPE